MQTISINFVVPQGWHKLSDKQLRYAYSLIASDFASDEIKTLCLLQWSGTKVIGRQDSGSYLLKKGNLLGLLFLNLVFDIIHHVVEVESFFCVYVYLAFSDCHISLIYR